MVTWNILKFYFIFKNFFLIVIVFLLLICEQDTMFSAYLSSLCDVIITTTLKQSYRANHCHKKKKNIIKKKKINVPCFYNGLKRVK